MSNPIIPQPRDPVPPSNAGWTLPILIVEVIVMVAVLQIGF